MSKHTKTNVMRTLETAGISYDTMEYDVSKGFVSGVDAAHKTGRDEAVVFKTLVTTGTSREHYVCVIPVAEELDLKKAAKAVAEKSIEMIKSKDLFSLTGYIHGGCSPIGMKKQFTTVAHITAEKFSSIYFSGGKLGCQIEMPFETLKTIVPVRTYDIIK